MGLVASRIVIASGTSLSPTVDTDGLIAVAIQFPSGWDAASITFQGSPDPRDYSRDGVTTAPVFTDLYDSAGEVAYSTAGANRMVALNRDHFDGVRQFKIRSGTTGVAVNQTANRTLVVLFRPEY